MMLELDAEELAVLGGVLQSYLSDLRMEIADTDRQAVRDGLKNEEAVIKRLIVRLGASVDAARS